MNDLGWHDLMSRLSILAGGPMLNQLHKAYSERHRKYHTMEHVRACLQHFENVRGLAEEPHAIELAIWFHDAVYKTRSSKNEADSAFLAQSFLEENTVDNDIIKKVVRLILATKHDAPIYDGDTALLVDIDLAILGAEERLFWEFEENVREEYSWVPWFLYRRERTKILRSFLDRPSIYSTANFQEKFEKRAKANIEAAIERLRQ